MGLQVYQRRVGVTGGSLIRAEAY